MQPLQKEKKQTPRWVVTLWAIVLTTVITTLAVDATDNRGDLSKSLLGAVIFGTTEEVPCPQGMTIVEAASGDFCIDRFEVSASEECLFHRPQTNDETIQNLESTSCKAISKPDRLPWTHIARHQAELACAQAGKHLPTNEEWYLAALGTPDSDSAVRKGICHIGGNTVNKTRTRDDCVSSSGAYDMIGNVWEWVGGTVIDGSFSGRPLPEEGYITAIDVDGTPLTTRASGGDKSFQNDYFNIEHVGVKGMFRGGFYGSGSDAGQYALNALVPPSFSGGAVGFRCAL